MIQNINGLPLLLGEREADGMEALLGRMGTSGNEFRSLLNNNNFAKERKNPLLNYNWQLPYSLDDFSKKFFDQSRTIKRENFTFNFGGPIPNENEEEVDEDEVEEPIKSEWWSFDDKNQNGKLDFSQDKDKNEQYVKKLFDIRVFTSKNGAWLLEQSKLLGKLKDNEFVVFAEIDDNDIVSEKVLLCKSGKIGAKFFDSKNFVNFVNKYANISSSQIKELIKNSYSEKAFLNYLKKLSGKTIEYSSWVTEKLGDGIKWVGNKIEELHIKKENWDVETSESTTKYINEVEDSIRNYLEKIDEDKGIYLFDGNDLIPDLIPFKDNFDLGIILPLPDFILKAFAKLSEFIAFIFSKVKALIIEFGNIVESIIACFCGIINGIVDLIAGIFLFIGSIVKLLGNATKNTFEFVSNLDYYIPLLMEYIDNFVQGVFKIKWEQIFNKIVNGTIEIGKALLNISINKNEISYFCGYLGINIAACFVGIGEISVLLKVERFTGIFAELIDAAYVVVNKLPKPLAATLEGLMELLGAYVGLLYKGTKSVLDIINLIFAAILGYLVKKFPALEAVIKNIKNRKEHVDRGEAELEKRDYEIDKIVSKRKGDIAKKKLDDTKVIALRRIALRKWRSKFKKKFHKHFDGEMKITNKKGKVKSEIEGGHNHEVNGTIINIVKIRKPPGATINNLPDDVPFMANVEFKKNLSSFFPKNWNLERVYEEIAFVYDIMLKNGKSYKFKNNKFKNLNSEGSFEIQIEFDELGNLTSAYPLINL